MANPENQDGTLLLDLPSEILRLIATTVYLKGAEQAKYLLALSLSCKTFSEIVTPIIFRSMTVDLTHARTTDSSMFNRNMSFLQDAQENVLKHITDFRLVHCPACLGLTFSPGTNIHACLRRVVSEMENLGVVRFQYQFIFLPDVLEILRHRPMHIILDFRNAVLKLSDISCILEGETKWTWSLAMHKGTSTEALAEINIATRLRALQWSSPTSTERRSHVRFLDSLHSSQLLEEVHVSEKELDEVNIPDFSYAPQICLFITSLLNLRRLRVEGSDLIKELLNILPGLTSIEDLSLYSSYRFAFHEGCSDSEGVLNSTGSMPWLALPRLKTLDVRFICRHFSIQEIVPPGMKALRVEFYGPDERFSLEDLQWLCRNCPELERLELDVGNLGTVALDGNIETCQDGPTSLLFFLQNFRCLRVLRLFPSYWHQGKMRVHPFPEHDWPVFLFRRLRSMLVSLQVLTICISYGEFPFDIMPRMSYNKRPKRFTVKSGADDSIVLQHVLPSRRTKFEQLFEFAQTTNGHETSKSTSNIFCASTQAYFEDLGEDWILPHIEVVYNDFPPFWS